jgi:excisionase family DNA binding protein
VTDLAAPSQPAPPVDESQLPLVANLNEAAAVLRVSRSYVADLVRQGRLHKLSSSGRRVLIPRWSLLELINEGRQS